IDTKNEIDQEVDELICLTAPVFFGGVGQVYENFGQTEDEQVIELMEKSKT
ncbi:phosphoribosyltransferase, partial [Candidatus Dependentiae bacterium]|nr:phosphoribosyltransferase [Candidatus Dependentiae bacterium]